jgi:hypothetical protein
MIDRVGSCAAGVNWPTKSNILSTHGLIVEGFSRTEAAYFIHAIGLTLEIASRLVQRIAALENEATAEITSKPKAEAQARNGALSVTHFMPGE